MGQKPVRMSDQDVSVIIPHQNITGLNGFTAVLWKHYAQLNIQYSKSLILEYT